MTTTPHERISAPAEVPWAMQVSALGIVEIDPQGYVRAFNPGAEGIKGYRADEVLGAHFSLFYRPDDRASARPRELLDAALREGFVEDTGWRVRADGSTFWAHVTITAIRDAAGVHTGFVNIVRDLSTEKRASDEWTTYLQTFAHDLLSPVTAISGYLDLLAESTDLPPLLLQRAIDASEHVAEMTRVLSQRLRDREEQARRPARLASLAREAAALVLPGDIHRRLHIDVDTDPTVMVDPISIRRCVANLVENAAKYSDDRIDIRVQVADVAGAAVLTVTDHGRGIHPDDLEQIFQAGYRGRLAEAGDGGTGLGLASARDLIAEQGGAIRVHSELGVGTTVRVELPLAQFETHPAAAA